MYKSAINRLAVTCHLPTDIFITLTVTLLNNSVELSSNLYPESLNEWNWYTAADPIFKALQWLNWFWALVCKPVG